MNQIARVIMEMEKVTQTTASSADAKAAAAQEINKRGRQPAKHRT